MENNYEPLPSFDSAEFYREIDKPVTVDDPYSNESYRFYVVNREYNGENTPLVAYNGLGSTPNTLIGQQHLHSYARAIPRTIIAPMNLRSSNARRRREFADGHARALEKIHDDPVDITGMSWGGVLAYSVAESIQDKADHLITTSSVGTRRTLATYALASASLLIKERRQINEAVAIAISDTQPEEMKHIRPSLDQIDKLQRARLIGGKTLQALPHTLHPSTTWRDIIGENDVLTNVRDHLNVIRDRNRLHPGSSSISVVANHGHMWSHMRPALADLVRESLEQHQEGDSTAVHYYRSRPDFSGVDAIAASDNIDTC